MTMPCIPTLLERIACADRPRIEDLVTLLQLEIPRDLQALFVLADRVRRRHVGDEILLRGLVEFSSHCTRTCRYCGLNRSNRALERYRLTREQILACAAEIASQHIKTIVLQAGEDPALDTQWLAEIIHAIKRDYPMAVTLSVGERPVEDYVTWQATGADRYLIKIETSHAELYQQHHPGMDFQHRLDCIRTLQDLGYQTGSGCIVGLKGQTLEHLAQDLLFLKQQDLDMVSIGVFLPHPETELGKEPTGDVNLAIKMIALARILTRDTHIPSATAISTAGGSHARTLALKAGANVVMPNFTPACVRGLYEIYPHDPGVRPCAAHAISEIRALSRTLGRHVSFSIGDSIKRKACNQGLCPSRESYSTCQTRRPEYGKENFDH